MWKEIEKRREEKGEMREEKEARDFCMIFSFEFIFSLSLTPPP